MVEQAEYCGYRIASSDAKIHYINCYVMSLHEKKLKKQEAMLRNYLKNY